MKIAFISDIHGNAVALEAVLEDIGRKDVDKIVVLGDIAYRGPEPKRSIQLVRELNADVIKGNVDEWTVRGVREGEVPETVRGLMNKERDWMVARLDQEDLGYLNGLPINLKLKLTDQLNVHAFHSTPDSMFDLVLPDANQEVIGEKLMAEKDASVFVYAHIHLPYVRYINGKCVVNTGSVGLPFDGMPKSSYVILEGEGDRYRAAIERVEYDVERVVKQYRDGEYPNLEPMIRAVREGVSPFSAKK